MLYYTVILAYIAANLLLALVVFAKSHNNIVSRFYTFCVGCLILLGAFSYLLNQHLNATLYIILDHSIIFIYSLFPFFFLHFAVVFIRQHDILRSKSAVPAIYTVGLISYTVVLLGFVDRPISETGEVTSSGYTFYLIWMSIFLTIGIAMLYEVARGFYDKPGKSNFLFACFALLLLILPGPFTDSVFFKILRFNAEAYYFSCMISLAIAVYFIFRHKIIINTLFSALKSALGAINDIFLTMDDSFRIERARGRAITSLLGYTESELQGQMFTNFIDRAADLADYRSLVLKGKMAECYLTASVKGKKVNNLQLNFSFAPMFINNQLTGFVAIGRDITDLKKTEEELIKLRKAVERTAEVIFMTDQHGTFTYVNPAFTDLYGYPPEEIVGKTTPRVLKSGLLQKEDYENFWQTILQKQVFRAEIVNKTKDDKLIHIESSANPILDDAGNILGFLAIQKDITKRKQMSVLVDLQYRIAEAASVAKEMNELYGAVHDIIKEVIDARNFYIALYEVKTNSVSFPYFVDEQDSSNDPNEWRPLKKGMTEYVIRTGKPMLCTKHNFQDLLVRGDVELLGPDSAVWLGVPLKVNLRTIGVMAVQHYTNINAYNETDLRMLEFVSIQIAKAIERSNQEENLRRSEEQFRLISENVADLIAVLDTEGRRVYSSPSYTSIIGTPEHLQGTSSFHEIHPDDREKMKAIFEETLKTGIGNRAEYRFVRPDGSIRHIESQGSVVRNTNGDITNIIVVGRDVTEKKTLEQQFLRAQRLESLGTLASGIAHDLNNVLAPILLSIRALSQAVSTESGKKILASLETSAKRGTDIIKQVLAFARGVEGERTLLQPRHLISEVVSIVKGTFSKNISIEENIPKDLWSILGDPTQIHQLLMNLCINAHDAMPKGGKLLIAAENKIIDEQYVRMNLEARPGRYVMLSIEDTGTGMSPRILDRIFEPFFTTKAPGKGTGLGLSTVHTIVKSHLGFTNVYSEPGQGTTFRIYLPASETQEATVVTEEKRKLLYGNGELILVVDDEVSIGEVTKQTLETFGYRVLTALNGVEAVALYTSHSGEVALVITDMMMPEMDGTQTIIAIRKLNPRAKIIGSSGLVSSSDTAKGFGAAADGFIAKPYTADNLLETIHSVLHK